jgi:hypothetical protein
MENQLMELDYISDALNAISGHTKLAHLIQFIPRIVLQSTDPPTKALNKIHFITIILTPTCFGTEVPSSGSLRTKDYKPNMIITNM